MEFCERGKDLKKLMPSVIMTNVFVLKGYVYHCNLGKVFHDFNMLTYYS